MILFRLRSTEQQAVQITQVVGQVISEYVKDLSVLNLSCRNALNRGSERIREVESRRYGVIHLKREWCGIDT